MQGVPLSKSQMHSPSSGDYDCVNVPTSGIFSINSRYIRMSYSRHILPLIRETIADSPVTLLNGPRQTGKTTLMELLAKESVLQYVSFDDVRHLGRAREDPIGFVADLQKPVILDEIQRAPELLLPIKQDFAGIVKKDAFTLLRTEKMEFSLTKACFSPVYKRR